MDRSIIDKYEQGSQTLREAVRGLSREQLLAFPVPNTWSIQQIVIHLLDSDLIYVDRMKRTIAEENPTLMGFDESKFVQNLHYEEWPIEEALTMFELNRRNFVRLLRKLPDSAFGRIGQHNERGPMTVQKMLETMVWHVDHHLKFAREKRAMLAR